MTLKVIVMVRIVDVLTVHFGHSGWTERLVDSILSCSVDDRVEFRTVHIVDNSRDGWIRNRLPNTSGLLFHEFPVDEDQMEYYFHDHAASLVRGIEESDADILVILDCDAHIIDSNFLSYVAGKFLDEGFDAITAPDKSRPDAELCHPCFLVLSRAARQNALPFDSRKLNSDHDVGRLIRQFLVDHGLRVYVPKCSRAFDGAWGEFFDGEVYHHGSGTFQHSQSMTLTKQVDRCAWVFDQSVLRDQKFKLGFFKKWLVRILSRLPSVKC